MDKRPINAELAEKAIRVAEKLPMEQDKISWEISPAQKKRTDDAILAMEVFNKGYRQGRLSPLAFSSFMFETVLALAADVTSTPDYEILARSLSETMVAGMPPAYIIELVEDELRPDDEKD